MKLVSFQNSYPRRVLLLVESWTLSSGFGRGQLHHLDDEQRTKYLRAHTPFVAGMISVHAFSRQSSTTGSATILEMLSHLEHRESSSPLLDFERPNGCIDILARVKVWAWRAMYDLSGVCDGNPPGSEGNILD